MSLPSLISTSEIAPVAARIPMEMRAPSNAGPAAVEAQSIRSRLPTTSSPLVPRSISATNFSVSWSLVASTPARMSLPTKPPRHGRKWTRGFPGRFHPRSPESETCSSGEGVSNGYWESGSTLIPQNRWCMTVLPTITTLARFLSPVPARTQEFGDQLADLVANQALQNIADPAPQRRIRFGS